MRRTLIIVTAAAAALGGVWAASAVAPCALPRALSDKIRPGQSRRLPRAGSSRGRSAACDRAAGDHHRSSG